MTCCEEAFVSVVSLLVRGGGVGCLFRSSSFSAKHSLASSTSSSLVRCACYDCSCRELKSVSWAHTNIIHKRCEMFSHGYHVHQLIHDSYVVSIIVGSVFTFTFHSKRWLFLISHSLLLFTQLASGLMKICFNGGQVKDREQQRNFSCKFTSLSRHRQPSCVGGFWPMCFSWTFAMNNGVQQ